MIPPKWTVTDWPAYQRVVADNYIAALQGSKVKYVLILSSVGAHLRKGAGPIDGTAYLEEQSEKLTGIQVHILRPSSFYYNLFNQIGMIKHAGFIGSTQPADFKIILTDVSDIADAAAAWLLNPSASADKIEYLASDDTNTWTEITKVLGKAIGKPELPYVQVTDEQSRAGMLQAGLPPTMVDGYVTMGKCLRDGKMQEDYWKSDHKTEGKIKLADFAKQFASAFNAS